MAQTSQTSYTQCPPNPILFYFLYYVVYLFIYGSVGSSLLLGLSLPSASRVSCLLAVLKLLIAVVSLVAEHRF